jgi:hypothetical protein
MAQFNYSNSFENKFWLQIMGDNAIIVRDHLISPGAEKKKADQFFSVFEDLLVRARQDQGTGSLTQLNRDALTATQEFRSLLLEILKRQVTQGVTVLLNIEFLNIMVSMTNIYLFLLKAFISNNEPEFVPINQDIFWLPVFYNESRYIADNVGSHDERQKADTFSNSFSRNYLFALELQEIYQIGTTEFPISNQYRVNILAILNSFAFFIVDLIRLARKNRLLGTLTILDLDHVYRKLCYYTTQLSIIQNVPKPACDPTSPRLLS